MSTELRRYAEPCSVRDLPRLLADPTAAPSEPLGLTRDFQQVRAVFQRLLEEKPGDDRAAWDAELVEPLHRALRGLSYRVAADMRFWHWMCIAQFQDLVWHRWYGGVPDPLPEIRPALAGRFLGSPTLHGVSRNALARLWWCAESLYSDAEGYSLARQALAKQDLFQAIFERKFGLYPPAVRACLRKFRDAGEEAWREGTRRLNHYLTTIVAEALSEEEIAALLSE